MSKPVNNSDLVDAKAISVIVGLTPRTVRDQFTKQLGFPAPIKHTKPLKWPRREVEKFLRIAA
jgi:predicted DNA-binding transcriptional regulator AlpA